MSSVWMGPNEYILSESNHTRFVLAPLILELPSTFCLPSNWLTSKLVPVPNQWIGPQPSMDAFWLAASPPARGAPLSRPRFKKSAQFALIRHRPAADLDRPSGSDTTTEEPTTDLATARAACLWSCQGGVGSPESRGDGVALKRSPFLLDMKGLRCRTLCLPTCTCQRNTGRKTCLRIMS